MICLVPFALSLELRAAAGELFRVFRMQEVQVIPLSAADAARFEQAPTEWLERLGEELFPSSEEQEKAWPQAEERVPVAHLKAKGLILPQYIPVGYEARSFGSYIPAWEISKQVNVAKVNQLLAEGGIDYRLPDKEPVMEFRYKDGYQISYSLGRQVPGLPVFIQQMGTREWSAPNGVDLNGLWAAGVEQVLLPAVQGQGEAVTVNEAPGLFERVNNENRLVWMKDGITWQILAQVSREEMMKIAQSTK